MPASTSGEGRGGQLSNQAAQHCPSVPAKLDNNHLWEYKVGEEPTKPLNRVGEQ